MRRELLVPKLGLTMTEGTLVEWMVSPGQAFRADQSLFVVESEKAATEIPAEADGVLLEITGELGATLPVGTVIGYWDDGEAGEATASPATGEVAAAPQTAPSRAEAPAVANRRDHAAGHRPPHRRDLDRCHGCNGAGAGGRTIAGLPGHPASHARSGCRPALAAPAGRRAPGRTARAATAGPRRGTWPHAERMGRQAAAACAAGRGAS